MKKLSLIFSVLTVVALLFSSCAKLCHCTYYEDGKKIATFTDNDVKYFESSICEDNSESPRQGPSMITEGKEVTIEIKCK